MAPDRYIGPGQRSDCAPGDGLLYASCSRLDLVQNPVKHNSTNAHLSSDDDTY